MPGQHEHRGAQSQPARARAEPGQQVERGRDLAIAGEVVLDNECAVEAERLGLDVVVDELAEPLAAVELGTTAPCCRTAEQAELHCLLPKTYALCPIPSCAPACPIWAVA